MFDMEPNKRDEWREARSPEDYSSFLFIFFFTLLFRFIFSGFFFYYFGLVLHRCIFFFFAAVEHSTVDIVRRYNDWTRVL